MFSFAWEAAEMGAMGGTEASCCEIRSYRPCSLVTPEPVDMRDEIVSSQLRHRLGRPGRFSRVYYTTPFHRFLEDIEQAGQQQDGSARENFLDYGVLLTTGRCSPDARALVDTHNGKDHNRQVRLTDGDELADLFLKYFPPTLE